MRLPFDWAAQGLEPDDFVGFEAHFARIIKELFLCETVFFIIADQNTGFKSDMPERFAAGVTQCRNKGVPVVDSESPILYLPIFHNKKGLAIAILIGGNSSLFEKSVGWLQEKTALAVRECRLLKKMAVDPTTGLLNGRLFYEALACKLLEGKAESSLAEIKSMSEDQHGSGDFALFLLEIYPRERESRQALLYLSKAGSHLNSLVGEYTPVYHLGAGLFAFTWQTDEHEQVMKMGNAILDWLKREQLVRVHVGIALAKGESGSIGVSSEVLLEQAWYAIEKARHRGPYSLCTYSDPDSIDTFSLKMFPPDIIAGLKKAWRPLETFALVLTRNDLKQGNTAVWNLVAKNYPMYPVNKRDFFVLLENMDEETVRNRLDDLARQIYEETGTTVSMGIALYPCNGFSKADMPINAKKALVHTEFFGPDSRTVFDAVSLNISGDVYYNDGYLSKAVREYKLGLEMAPASTNLLNSLGVAYAQMNRHKAAIPLFKKVLVVEPRNFMALCNLGFSLLEIGQPAKAIDSFEQAVVLDDSHFDLLLQLGRLYCQNGKFEEAVAILTKAADKHVGDHVDIGFAAMHRYLGEAYKELGNLEEAKANLQRAVRHNPRDAAVISLLGEVYGLAAEGKEISLSLCHQAVELDDTAPDNWYRLGKIQFKSGYGQAAIISLKEALRLNRKNVAAAFLLARVYDDMGMGPHAKRMYERVLMISPAHKGAEEALIGNKQQMSST